MFAEAGIPSQKSQLASFFFCWDFPEFCYFPRVQKKQYFLIWDFIKLSQQLMKNPRKRNDVKNFPGFSIFYYRSYRLTVLPSYRNVKKWPKVGWDIKQISVSFRVRPIGLGLQIRKITYLQNRSSPNCPGLQNRSSPNCPGRHRAPLTAYG